MNEWLSEKVEESKKILTLASEMSRVYYHKPLIVTYSGGKDSDVMVKLAIECLNTDDFEIVNTHTSVDAPETVYYIRERFREWSVCGIKCTVQVPRYPDGRQKTMWNLIPTQGPPTRLKRFCCAELKEMSIPNRFISTGVRAAESNGRKGRNVFATRGETKKDAYYYYYSHIKEQFDNAEAVRKEIGLKPNDVDVYDCKFIEQAKQNKILYCNPIYEWSDKDVWEFIRDRVIPYNPLYDQGYKRVGCVGCPMSTSRIQELNKYPKFKDNYKRAFKKWVEYRREKGLYEMYDGDVDKIYAWWVQDEQIPGQLEFDLDGNIKEHKA